MAEPTPPAGWYTDPRDPWQDRLWDGESWTTEVRPKPIDVTPDPATPDHEPASPLAALLDTDAGPPVPGADDATSTSPEARAIFDEPAAALRQRNDDFWAKKDQETRKFVGPVPRDWLLGLAAIVAALGLFVIFLRLGDSGETATTTPQVRPGSAAAATTTTTDPDAPDNPATTEAPAAGSDVTATTAPTSTEFAITIPPTDPPPAPAQIAVPVGEAPFGVVDQIGYTPSTREVRLSGWVMDGDARAPVEVSLIVDLAVIETKNANERRPDLAPIYRNGVRHGFEFVFTLPPGEHTYCVTASNLGPGPDDSSIFCETRTIT